MGFPNFENMNSKIQFFFNGIKFTLRHRGQLKAFLSSIFKFEKQKLDYMNIIFCTDDQLLNINKDFLKHHYFTDIITFNFSSAGKPAQAELYISIERVRENAKKLGVPLKTELHRVVFHGCLHLCGYSDKTSQQIKKMREREDHYLRLYFGKLIHNNENNS
jgi:rRNA maturation RNase YbeY